MNANSGARLTASRAELLRTFALGWLKRRLLPSAGPGGQRLATDGSWPNYGWYVNHSRTLDVFWSTVPVDERKRVSRYWGGDPWSVTREQWSRAPLDFFRLLTLLNWLNLRRDEGCSALPKKVPALGSSS